MTESKKPRRTFTPEFKHQLVQLYKNGKSKSEITKEYDVGYSTLDKWINQESNSGSFKEKDNLTPEQEELLKLRKENQQLLIENDILKQAALILGRK
ncbi:transposase [Natranaerovirga hydrolytica]|uniref:Transposase n=1 Tax=Natranaerovirga hydrolytica TaxID=680378 RepID=A0A4V2Q1Q5_9FIRM|nr:transposase [Natranaerovirga hydrolytica]